MKYLYLILFLFSIQSTQLFAQGEYNNWVFGDSIWLDFNSGSPIVGNKPSYGHSNAASSISDKNGNLLFWMDTYSLNHPSYQAARVWNANGVLMQNGDSLFGYSEHQNYTIVPFPCNDSLYYIFTKGDFTSKKILYYSVVNMNLNNGLGAIVQKNIFVDSNLTAAFAVTRHGNNKDFWISYQQFDTNVHITRQISSTGIGPQVISTLGTNAFYGTGYLKFSGNSYYLVNCFRNLPVAEIYHFNNHTGILSNSFQLNAPTGSIPFWAYRNSQFSSDNNKLYVNTGSPSMLFQYDFSSGIPSAISNSGQIISTSNSTNLDMALGPDGKIYTSKGFYTWLGVINQPNALGTSCNYVVNAINAGDSTWGGLPTIIPSLFVHRDISTDSLLCQYETINLYLSDTNYIDSLVWNFGDTASGVANTSTDVIPLHVYNTYGTYPMEVIIYSGCVNDTIHDTIRINPTPIANLGPDTILCEGDSMQLLFNDTSFNYLWSTGDTTMSIQILNSDTFSIAVSSICGVDYDTIVIDSLIPALVHLPNDTLLCTGDSLLLDATIQSGNYLWSTADTLNSIWATNQNTYWVAAQNFCGSDTDTVIVNYTHPPLFDFGYDTSLCVGDTLTLNAYDTLSSYLWSTGDTFALDTIITNGIYSVTTTNLCGTYSDTIQAWFLAPPIANLGNDTVICLGDTIALSDTTLFGAYLWSDASVNDTFLVSSSGNYAVTVTNLCGSDADTVFVDTDTIPIINLGNDTVLCNGDSVLLSALFSRSSYSWSTGSTDSVIYANTQNTYWAMTTNLCGSDSDSIFIDVDSILNVNLGPDSILCLGEQTTIYSNVIGDSYSWSTGSSSDSLIVVSQDTYSLTVTNVCGSFTDTIAVHYDNSPITNLGPDSTYCLSSLVNLNAHWSRANYLWNTADTTSNITANFSGNYSVMVTNLCGFDDDTVMISYDIPINFNLGPDTILCVGDSFLIAAPAHNATWVWNTGSTDSTIVIKTSGNYQVSALNHCGAFNDSINVISETVPVVNPTILDTAFCEGETFDVVVTKNNASSILWLNGSNNYTQSFDSTGWYSYALQNICGVTSDTFRLEIQYPADAFLGNDTMICYGEKIVKSFDYPNHIYLWNNGLTNSVQIITATGIYGVTIFTPAKCESYAEILVESCNAQLFIPNAFTPENGDQLNNTFKVQGEGIRKYHIVIYDRWGMMVFESFDLDNSWNGTSSASATSEPASQGIYSYKIWYNTGESSQSVVKMGSFTLIR